MEETERTRTIFREHGHKRNKVDPGAKKRKRRDQPRKKKNRLNDCGRTQKNTHKYSKRGGKRTWEKTHEKKGQVDDHG